MLNKDLLKESLTAIDIEKIFNHYKAHFKYGEQGELIGQTICHNKSEGSLKLYYYPESHSFHCYTECACSFDIYELVQKIEKTRGTEIDFFESLQLVADILGVSTGSYRPKIKGFGSKNKINDWDFINKYKRRRTKDVSFTPIDENILKIFEPWYPQAWIEEGISPETHHKFDIRFYPEMNQTIVPHRDQNGTLIGIRVRNWRNTDKNKYMPLYYNNTPYNHALGFALYGLYENMETIKRVKKVMIVEGEKSVLKSHSDFGDSNFCVAICGSNMSKYQADLLTSVGVEKVFIALDKDYEDEPTEDYMRRVHNIAKHFANKASVFHISDTRDKVDVGDCVLDMPKEVVVDVMRNDKYLIHPEDVL